MTDTMLQLELKHAPRKLRELFPNDFKGDVTIVYKNSKYVLQKAHLRLYSQFFKTRLTRERTILQLEGDFDEQVITNVLHMMYGLALQIQRKDVLNYYPVIKYLGIQELIKSLQKDILSQIGDYNIFELFDLSMKEEQQAIFEQCLKQLTKDQFRRLKSDQESFLKVSEAIFKLIITTYNRQDKKKALSNYQIAELINNYCYIHQLGFQYAKGLKFQLIDKQALSSEEYKKIFLQKKPDSEIFLNKSSSDQSKTQLFKVNSAESWLIDQGISAGRSLTLQMQNNLEYKINKQLSLEQSRYKNQINCMHKVYQDQLKKSLQIKEEIMNLRRSVSQNQKDQIKEQLSKIEQKLNKMQKRIGQTSQKFAALQASSKLLLSKQDASDLLNQKNLYVSQAQNPDFFMGQFMNPKISQRKDSISEQQLYFDVQSQVLKTKEQLKTLREFFMVSRFSKKKLNLILRRSKTKNYGKNKDIRGNFQSLLFLFRTRFNKVIGAQIHEMIPTNKDTIKDEKANIFSISGKEIFKINQQDAEGAISFNKGYLICFGTDLMIAEDPIEDESLSQWPTSYARSSKHPQANAKWLAGQSQFLIDCLECYKIEERELQMII